SSAAARRRSSSTRRNSSTSAAATHRTPPASTREGNTPSSNSLTSNPGDTFNTAAACSTDNSPCISTPQSSQPRPRPATRTTTLHLNLHQLPQLHHPPHLPPPARTRHTRHRIHHHTPQPTSIHPPAHRRPIHTNPTSSHLKRHPHTGQHATHRHT